ncbi:MAG: hypothetical protein ACK41T_03210 [Pseudobdellovibrio sp.]
MKIFILSIASFLLTFINGCTWKSETQQQTKKNDLRIEVSQVPSTLNAHKTT